MPLVVKLLMESQEAPLPSLNNGKLAEAFEARKSLFKGREPDVRCVRMPLLEEWDILFGKLKKYIGQWKNHARELP